MLEEMLVLRISSQSGFDKTVHFGDKVYVVRFSQNGPMFRVYDICNPNTKKVELGHFYLTKTIRTRK